MKQIIEAIMMSQLFFILYMFRIDCQLDRIAKALEKEGRHE